MKNQGTVKVIGIPLPGEDYTHLCKPGIYDGGDECPGSSTHIARLRDGRLFDLGPAEKTASQVHVFEGGQDTGRHIPVEWLRIVGA
ncbi:MAG: hypothetical protein COT24_01670 [Candidatus Kerfeldbacteria bacterium CG08_land_8_20_14_0_20_40_16]|uniref:Uncharacterized protein n=1 Tax=Candidatus Kerfeldbacteria bacterium CG08_land_8_20_14_0_20_40_16 TaxID=2014244 RepID=A0A2H0YWG2_9BACT|nr:MAG: hypothetical protein COT24_01670 [Candidatus Kerfeldbacteria bacterium CG08_land_8_20_14_0_20_40_16]